MSLKKYLSLIGLIIKIIGCILTTQNVNSSSLDIVKCCGQDEVLDVQSQTCIQNATFSSEYDFLLDLFHYSIVHTDNLEGNFSSPSQYNITSIGKPECDISAENLEIVINSEEPGNNQFIIAYPTNELFETNNFKYHQNFCVDVAYSRNQYWGIAALFCNINLNMVCQNKTCARFCCSPGLVYDTQIGYCRPAFDLGIYQMLPRLYKEETGTELHLNHNQTEFIYGVPDCFKDPNRGYTSHPLQHDRIFYNNSGYLKVGSHYFNYEQACILQTEQFDEVSHNYSYVTQANVCMQSNS